MIGRNVEPGASQVIIDGGTHCGRVIRYADECFADKILRAKRVKRSEPMVAAQDGDERFLD